jgi:hypothetical protein
VLDLFAYTEAFQKGMSQNRRSYVNEGRHNYSSSDESSEDEGSAPTEEGQGENNLKAMLRRAIKNMKSKNGPIPDRLLHSVEHMRRSLVPKDSLSHVLDKMKRAYNSGSFPSRNSLSNIVEKIQIAHNLDNEEARFLLGLFVGSQATASHGWAKQPAVLFKCACCMLPILPRR